MVDPKGVKLSSRKAEKDRFLDRTLETWQPFSSRSLTREDGREITENVANFFRILQEWKAKEKLKLFS